MNRLIKGKGMKHNNFHCWRCDNIFFYSPSWRHNNRLCVDCVNSANWFWKLINKC